MRAESEPVAPEIAEWVGLSAIPALVTDGEGHILCANQAAAAILDGSTLPEGLEDAIVAAQETQAAQLTNFSFTAPEAEPGVDGRRLFETQVVPLIRAGRGGEGQMVITAREITLEVNLCNTLVESRRRYKDLVECSVDFAWETDVDGRLTFISSDGALGFPASWLEGQNSRLLLQEAVPGALNPFVSKEPLNEATFKLKDNNGDKATVSICVVPIFNDDGEWTGARGVCRDITLISEHEDALRLARERAHLLNSLIKSIRDCVDPESMLREAARQTALALNAPLCTVLRDSGDGKASSSYSHDAGMVGGADILQKYAERQVGQKLQEQDNEGMVLGEATSMGLRMVAALTRHNHKVNGAMCLARPENAGPWTEWDQSLLLGVTDYVAIAIAQFEAQDKLRTLARTDDLTGLMNRRGFLESVEPRMVALRRRGQQGALLYVDLDNFKQINDRYGHDRGDTVLKALGAYLDGHTRGSDYCARLGGDEFAIWLDNASTAGAVKRAEELLDLAGPLNEIAGETDEPLSLSVGIVVSESEDSDETLSNLLDRADHAMYGVKKCGKSSYVVALPRDMKKTG